VYYGLNIGRFINHGGLKEGLITLCQVCDREHGSTGYVNMEVQREFERCNVTYKRKMHSTLCVHAITSNHRKNITPWQLFLKEYGESDTRLVYVSITVL